MFSSFFALTLSYLTTSLFMRLISCLDSHKSQQKSASSIIIFSKTISNIHMKKLLTLFIFLSLISQVFAQAKIPGADESPIEDNCYYKSDTYHGKQFKVKCTYDLSRKRTNADGTDFYLANYKLSWGGREYDIPQDFYIHRDNENDLMWASTCVAYDETNDLLYFYAFSKDEGRDYKMSGYFYEIQQNKVSKYTVFEGNNWGWHAYFENREGTLYLNFFSYAMYYEVYCYRNGEEWKLVKGNSIKPDDFAAKQKQQSYFCFMGYNKTNPVVLEPSALNFGKVEIGQSKTLTMTIHNYSDKPATISNMWLSGFTFDWNGGIIEAGQSKTVAVTFTPTKKSSVSAGSMIMYTINGISNILSLSAYGDGIEAEKTEPDPVIPEHSTEYCLNVNMKDGSTLVFRLSEFPIITYKDNGMAVFTSGNISSEYKFSSINNMTYSKYDPNAINQTNVSKPFRTNANSITFLPNEKSMNVRIVSLKGVVEKQFTVKSGEELSIPFNTLPSGVCLININGVTYKTSIK